MTGIAILDQPHELVVMRVVCQDDDKKELRPVALPPRRKAWISPYPSNSKDA